MKVLLLTPWYPHSDNPRLGVFVREHARAIAMQHEVTVIHFQARITRHTGLTLICEKDENLIVWRLTADVYGDPRRVAQYLCAAVDETYQRLFIHRGFDIIHAHVTYPGGVAAAYIGEKYGIPVIITEHASFFEALARSPWRKRLMAYALGRAEYVVAVSELLAKTIQSHNLASNLIVIPNPVDLSLFSPPGAPPEEKGTIDLLSVGAMELNDRKGWHLLLEAAARLKALLPGVRLHLVGDGPAKERHMRMAEVLGIEDHCIFYGFVEHNRVAELMRFCDIFVLPSYYETFSCVLIEALACGKPVVSTRVGIAPQIVDAEVGVLISPGSVSELASALEAVVANLPEYKPAEIAKRAARFSLQEVAQAISSVYTQAKHTFKDRKTALSRPGRTC